MPTPSKHVRHGNYPRYYEFRRQDSRAQLFQEIWPQCLDELNRLDGPPDFRNIHMLDIGCNRGKLTNLILSVLQKSVFPRGQSVRGLGLDIDAELVKDAIRSNTAQKLEFAEGDISAIALGLVTENPIGNYLTKNSIQRFDFVSCFSVLMYIHLNHGDDGLRKVLHYLCSVAKILVLELHPWDKYRDHARKMRRAVKEPYLHYDTLIWRGGQGKLEQTIRDFVVGQGFKIVCEQQKKNEWNMNFVVFSKVDN